MQDHPLIKAYHSFPDPVRDCLLAVRGIILNSSSDITEHLKYGLPFFYYKGKMMCYFWKDKTDGTPYIGFMDGPLLDFLQLEKEKRKRVKVLRLNPNEDIEVELISEILTAVFKIHDSK